MSTVLTQFWIESRFVRILTPYDFLASIYLSKKLAKQKELVFPDRNRKLKLLPEIFRIMTWILRIQKISVKTKKKSNPGRSRRFRQSLNDSSNDFILRMKKNV